MRIINILILNLSLGPLWWPLQILTIPEWPSITPEKVAETSKNLSLAYPIQIQKNSGRYYALIGQLNELIQQPGTDLLLKILNEAYTLTPANQAEEDIELLLLAKCALAEAHIIFSTVLALTGEINLLLLYWKTRLKSQYEKQLFDFIQTLPSQQRTRQEIEEIIAALTTIIAINNEFIGEIANFIATLKSLANKTPLRSHISNHIQKATAFLEHSKDLPAAKNLSNKELNRTLASNIIKVDDYNNGMKESNKDIEQPSSLEKNWLWYTAGIAGLIGIGSYIHKKGSHRHDDGTTNFNRWKAAAHNSYTSWWRNPIQRIKELLSRGSRANLISPETLEGDDQNFNTSFMRLMEDELHARQPTIPTSIFGEDCFYTNYSPTEPLLPSHLKNLNWDSLADPEALELEIGARVDSIYPDASPSTMNSKIKNWVGTCFDWRKRYHEQDPTIISEIQTTLGQSPLLNIANGRLPQVYNAQFQSLKLRVDTTLDTISKQVHDMELTIKLLALIPASLLAYVLYRIGKQIYDGDGSSETIYANIRHTMREISKLLNRNNTYIKTTPSFEDQGYLIFWINELKNLSDNLGRNEKSDFKEDIEELESEHYEVVQKLQTLQRMYNTYSFLSYTK